MLRKTKRIGAVAGSALMLAGVATASGTAASAVTPTPVYNGCANPLPTAVVGYPTGYLAGAKDTAAPVGSRTGVTVWHDGKGWHLRATHNEAKVTNAKGKLVYPLVQFEGRIISSRPNAVRGVALENVRGHRDAFWVVRPAKRVVGFRFMNYAGIDGLDFTNACAGKVTVEVWKVTRTSTANPDGTVTVTTTRTPVPVWTGKARTLATDAVPGDGKTSVTILRTKKP